MKINLNYYNLTSNNLMKISNVSLKAINAERYIEHGEKPKQIRIDHNSQVKRIRPDQDKGMIEFEYTASYGAVGVIRISGSLVVHYKDIKKVASEWQETKKMPDDLAGALHTAVMHACVPEAVGIAKDLGLPPPIPLPQVRLGKKPTSVTGQLGPEVA